MVIANMGDMRKLARALLLLLVGSGLTLVVQRHFRYSTASFPIELRMTESEVLKNFGKPREVVAIFSVLPPDEWPDSAKKYTDRQNPTSVWKYYNTWIYFASGRVCRIEPIRWDRL